MCQACGMNYFDEDDIDYDDEELMASLEDKPTAQKTLRNAQPNTLAPRSLQRSSPANPTFTPTTLYLSPS